MTLPFVFLQAGVFSAMKTWEELEAVIVHELGHYYLNHPSNMSNHRFDYFYNRKSADSVFRPTPDNSLKEDGEFLKSLGNLRSVGLHNKLFTSKASAQFFLRLMAYFTHIIYRVQNPQHLPPPQRRHYTKENIRFIYNEAKCRNLPKWFNTIRKHYLQETNLIEKFQISSRVNKIKSCMATIQPKNDTSMQSLLFAEKFNMKNAKYFLQLPLKQEFNSLLQAFQFIEPKISTSYQNLLQSEKLRNLGLYTNEEEADIFSINYFVSLNRDPKVLSESLVRIMEGYKSLKLLGGKPDKCISIYKNNWMLNNQKYTPILTDYHSKHHGLCFRLFNISHISDSLQMNSKQVIETKIRPFTDYLEIKNAYVKKNRFGKVTHFIGAKKKSSLIIIE